MTIARPGGRKRERLELRIEPERRRLLDEAAAEMGMSTSAFVLTHATTAAHHVLTDRVRFVLPAEHWEAFLEILDRDEQPVEGLAALHEGELTPLAGREAVVQEGVHGATRASTIAMIRWRRSASSTDRERLACFGRTLIIDRTQ